MSVSLKRRELLLGAEGETGAALSALKTRSLHTPPTFPALGGAVTAGVLTRHFVAGALVLDVKQAHAVATAFGLADAAALLATLDGALLAAIVLVVLGGDTRKTRGSEYQSGETGRQERHDSPARARRTGEGFREEIESLVIHWWIPQPTNGPVQSRGSRFWLKSELWRILCPNTHSVNEWIRSIF